MYDPWRGVAPAFKSDKRMNEISQALTTLFASLLRVLLWVTAGLAALTVTAMVLMALALAGVWAMLTGRRAWWTQLRQMHAMRRGTWRPGTAANASGSSAAGEAAAEPEHAATPFTRRRFGRAAGRVDVTDVTPRNVHS